MSRSSPTLQLRLRETRFASVSKSAILPSLAINVDALKISRAIDNIIRNAVEAIENRGTVKIEVTRDEKNASVIVSDDGKGIFEDDLDLIFEPFYTTKKDAMGLGLPYARQAIEAHDGSINVISGESGTTVKIISPLSHAQD